MTAKPACFVRLLNTASQIPKHPNVERYPEMAKPAELLFVI